MSTNRTPAPWRLAARTARMNPSAIREILKLTERPGIISLAGGLPSAETFPVEAMREATARVLRETPREALQYAASEGFAPLREWVAAEMARHGLVVDAAQVLITSGSQQGLDLVGKVLIDCRQPGRGRVADLPRRSAGVRSVRARIRDRRLRRRRAAARRLRRDGAKGARFLYALPNFQNPSGRSIDAARRAAIARAAEAIGVPIVEDNPYGELWFDAPPPRRSRATGARARSISAASRRCSRQGCASAT